VGIVSEPATGALPEPGPAACALARDAAHLVSIMFKGRRIELYQRNDVPVRLGDMVVVEVERGTDIGQVARLGGCELRRRHDESRRVLRLATADELEALETLRAGDAEHLQVVSGRVAHFQLPMHLVDAEFQADGNRVTFYFTAEHRVDFRALVRDLASIFRTRIELRQISARDAARRLGGLGLCGRVACCCSFLVDTERVSLSMAREQNRLQCPTRLSGYCGRLICCLGFENGIEGGEPGLDPGGAPA
jgi:cell fate regulator YaaT (PSP1 superfamily)